MDIAAICGFHKINQIKKLITIEHQNHKEDRKNNKNKNNKQTSKVIIFRFH